MIPREQSDVILLFLFCSLTAEATGESGPELLIGAVLHSFAPATPRCLSDTWTF